MVMSEYFFHCMTVILLRCSFLFLLLCRLEEGSISYSRSAADTVEDSDTTGSETPSQRIMQVSRAYKGRGEE